MQNTIISGSNIIKNDNLMAQTLNQRGFLQGRTTDRMSGTGFFHDNKIRTCSYIKQNGTTFTAVPFYDKRNSKEYPTRSTWTTSLSRDSHSKKSLQHAGMGMRKTLSTYHPDRQRNRMQSPDYIPPLGNSSSVAFGDRGAKDTKRYISTYNNSYRGSSLLGIPDFHPGITAYKNRWVRRQSQK